MPITVGNEEILNCSTTGANAGESVFSFTSAAFGHTFSTARSNMGVSVLHGPHQSA